MSCPECSNPHCEGAGRIRHFLNWSDLASHLSEDEIVHALNKLNAVWDDYCHLSEQRAQQQLNAKAKREEQARLLAYLKDNLSQEALARIKKGDIPNELSTLPDVGAARQCKSTFINRRSRRALLHISVGS
jgi:hypothetical protein